MIGITPAGRCLLALACLCPAAAVFAAGDGAAAPASDPASPAAAVATAPDPAGIPPLPDLSGMAPDEPGAIRVLLSPQEETTLIAQFAGRIESLQAGLGAPVHQGDVIVAFDCAEPQARLRMSQAENSAARQTLGVNQRLRNLDAAGEIEVALARTEVDKTAAAIELAKVQIAQCTVQAPFDGYVVKTLVKPYQGVPAGSPLVELVSGGALKVRLNVPSNLLAQLRVQAPLDIRIHETGKSYPAHITAINARVDAVAQTIELEAQLDAANPELLPGMSGTAHLRPQP